MTLTAADCEALDKRILLTLNELDILDSCLSDLSFRGRYKRMQLANDDRLAALEASFIRYLLASRDKS